MRDSCGGDEVIELTRLNGEALVMNAELIETIEATPDTVITLTTGKKLIVLEHLDEVVRRVLAYRRAAYGRELPGATGNGGARAADEEIGG